MKFILGTKEYMTQIFDEKGNVHPVTVVSAGPVTVTQLKNEETDGYTAVQFGYGAKKEKNASKAEAGHAKKARPDMKTPVALREVPVSADELSKVTHGDVITVEAFAEGEKIVVVSTSKSKGFAGVIKRHGFKGGPRSHGQKHSERAPGSLGMAGVQRVFKGMRMAGRLGGDRVTTRGLKVLKRDVEKNQLYISGAIPGRKGTLVEVTAR